jgi:hypothetical protein
MVVRLIVNPGPIKDDDDEEEDGPPAFYEILETPRSERRVDATVEVTFVVEEDSEDEYELVSLDVVARTNQPNVRIFKEENVTDIVNIQGTYFDPFEDFFTYVERGSSNLIETPKTVMGIPNLPPKKDYYDLVQDTTERVTVFYDVFVVYKDTLTEEIFEEKLEIRHDIYNEWEGMRTFVTEYYR